MNTELRLLAAGVIGAGLLSAGLVRAQTTDPASPPPAVPPIAAAAGTSAPNAAGAKPGVAADVRQDQGALRQDWRQFDKNAAQLQHQDNSLIQDRKTYQQDLKSGDTAGARTEMQDMGHDKAAITHDTRVLGRDNKEIASDRHQRYQDRKAAGLPLGAQTPAQQDLSNDRNQARQDARQTLQTNQQWIKDRQTYRQDESSGNEAAAAAEKKAMQGDRTAITQDSRALGRQDREIAADRAHKHPGAK